MLIRVYGLGINTVESFYEDGYTNKFKDITIKDNPICYE